MTTIMERLALRLQDEEQDIEGSKILDRLIAALDSDQPSFDVNEIYRLNGRDFDLALALLRDWRFRRHIDRDVGLRASLARLTGDVHVTSSDRTLAFIPVWS